MATRHLPHDWFDRALPDNVEVGDRSWIYSAYAFIHCHSRRSPGVRIGRDSGIYNGSFFELGPDGQVLIGDYCSIVGAIFATDASVVVSSYTFIAHEVVIADSFAPVPPRPNDRRAYHTGASAARTASRAPAVFIGENAWIGARATLLSGARIGDGAIVGACSVIDFEVPDGAVVAGNPARVVGSARSSAGQADGTR